MTSSNPDRLDKLLQQWAEQQAPCDAELDRLREQIVQSSAENFVRCGHPDLAHRPGGSRGLAAVGFALGVAAVVLIAIGFSLLFQPDHGGGEWIADRTGLPPSSAWMQESQLRDKMILLTEMESIFDRQATWVLETGKDVKIGVVGRPVQAQARPVAVRVVVERRQSGQPDWTIVWTADVVARSEEVVYLKPNSPANTQLMMWIYVLPDGIIAVDADLTLVQSTAVRMTTSSLHKDRQPVEACSTHVGGDEFRLFQTAVVLDEPVI